MQIALLTTGLEICGAIRHCYDLAQELARAGHRVHLLHRPESWIADQEQHPNVTLFQSDLRRNRRDLATVANYLRSVHCELIHTHLSGASFFGVLLARLYGFKSVATCHMPHLQPHWWWNDRIIVPCQSVKRFQRWVNCVPNRRIDVIPNFIDPERLTSLESAEEVRKSLRVPADAFVVGCIGTLDVRKGFTYLVSAIKRLNIDHRKIHVLSIGPKEAEYTQIIERQIRTLNLSDQIQLLGRRTDIPRLIRAMDCVCLPSLREVMPIALLEAMATGLPALATDVGGVKDCVRHELDGFVVPPRCVESLKDSLARWIKNPALAKTMGQSAQASMRLEFSPGQLIPRILQSYQAC